jgi:hypothetical protein
MADIVKVVIDKYVTSLTRGPFPQQIDEALVINTAMLICPFVFYFFLW